MRIVAKKWENNSNKIKEFENRIIAKIWSIIISSLHVGHNNAKNENTRKVGKLFKVLVKERVGYIN